MTGPVIAVHGGAGGFGSELRERTSEYREALTSALRAGAAAVGAGGGTAVDAVCAAVMAMEDFPLFNAGHGAALCDDGSVELSASAMRGSDRAAGAVALVRRTRYPVAAAAAMLDEPEVLLAGERADAFAAARGLEQRDPSEFVTERQRRRLAARLAGDGATVGAVCLDADGLLAAATSTGGLHGQPPGRVGDSPVIGAGTWADRHVAVSCTGQGEAFVRAGAARLLGALVANGVTLGAAARAVLDEVAECNGDGGLIAVDARGEVVLPFSTEAMPRGVWRDGEDPVVEVP
ncbi:MAG TPA: isoaspartyl peptidase/L-asparaginase [Solirubrobacteraceae bacterium]|nr:isoaspartyl peptidase/L-asparaginase [Solirubrobacteraceae bacterium]